MMSVRPIILTCAAFVILAFKVEKKPLQLFVLGDSISLGYGVYLDRYLKDDFVILRKGSQERAMKNLDVPVDANGGDSRMVLAYLQTRAADTAFHPSLMLLNCGLHDVKRNPATKTIAVDSSDYRNNLIQIFKLLETKRVPVIWVRTTGLVDSVHAAKSKAFNRYSADVAQYNRIADETCKQFNITEIDLYGFTEKQGDDRFADHVHYIPRVIEAQARFITKYVKNWQKKWNKN